MVIIWTLLAVLLGVNPTVPEMHELHLSKALVNYNAESRSLEVSLHVFIDDLELALEKLGMRDLYLATTKEAQDADEKIQSYLATVFKVVNGGQQVEFSFLGKEPSDDLMAIWCYLEATDVAIPEDLEITNRLLLELFDDQKNVVTFVMQDHREYFLFDHKKPSGSVKL